MIFTTVFFDGEWWAEWESAEGNIFTASGSTEDEAVERLTAELQHTDAILQLAHPRNE